jgi:serine/threonine protein kinase
MPSTIFLTLGSDIDAGHFAWRHLRAHVLPALNQRFAPVGVEVQLAGATDASDDGRDHLVTISPYSADDLSRPGRDVVEEVSQLIAAEYLGSTIESSVTVGDPDEAEVEAKEPQAVETTVPALPALKLPHRIDKYLLTRALGRGGMGEVYAAEQENLARRPVAMKLLRGVRTPGVKQRRFEFEAAVLARMHHPNIVTLYDAGRAGDGTMWMAMELVYGHTLLRYCDSHRLPVEQRLDLFAELCDAAAAIHSKGVIHRNLSPHNMMVTTLGMRPVVKVVDFGIAKVADHRDPLKGPRERQGNIYGSLAYMAPEQAIGSRDIDTRADIYVLGVVLYELLTGHKALGADPNEALDVDRVVQRILTRLIPPPSASYEDRGPEVERAAELRRSSPRALAKQFAGGLDEIVLRCVVKNPDERYAAAHQLANDLRAWRPKRGLLGS